MRQARSSVFAVGLVAVFALAGCSADATDPASAESDIVGQAKITLAVVGSTATANVVLGPQRQTLVPTVPLTCGQTPSSTSMAPSGWIELKNPSTKTAVVSFWTERSSGGPSMQTSAFVYTSPTAPTTSAQLAACTARDVGASGYWAGLYHDSGDPIVIAPSSSVYVLVADARRNQGLFRAVARTEALVDAAPNTLTIAPVGQTVTSSVLLSEADNGLVPTVPLTCGQVPSSTSNRPRAYVEVKNQTNKTAVLSLWTQRHGGGPSMQTSLAVYSSPAAPSTPSQLSACTSRDEGARGYWAGLFHDSGSPLILEPNSSAYVLIHDSRNGEGLFDVVARTEFLDD